MNSRLKNIALLLSICLNIAMVAGYVYGAVYPKPVASARVPPGLRDPNLTADQIQAIKKIQATRSNWLDVWDERYRQQLLAIVGILDSRDPDWTRVKTEQAKFLNLRQEYQDVLFRSWSDINQVLTPAQGKEYMEALREMIRETDFAAPSRTKNVNRTN